MRSLAAELLVLRKRASTWILLGVWVLLGLLFGYLLPYLTYKGGAGGLPANAAGADAASSAGRQPCSVGSRSSAGSWR